MARMSPSVPCAYILHPEMAATWRRLKVSPPIPLTRYAERLIGGGKDCQTQAWGNREPVFERAAQTKTAQPLAGLCGSEAELKRTRAYARFRLLIKARASNPPPSSAIETGSGTPTLNSPENEL